MPTIAALITGTPLVDQVWHDHLLMPQDYLRVCGILLGSGEIFEHSVLTADSVDREQRYANTLQFYEQLWGKPDSTIWPCAQANRVKSTVQVFVRTQTGITRTIEADLGAPIEEFTTAVFNKFGIPVDEQRLICHSRVLTLSSTTLAEQQVGAMMTIFLDTRLKGC